MSNGRNRMGTCALTGHYGPYVKSHIIPNALTRPEERGAPLMQTTKGEGYKRRFTSWYDKELVTREGEDQLTVIDTDGISELRRNLLIWSSWVFYKPAFEQISPGLPTHSFRIIPRLQARKIHLFFISIAWRSVASQMDDMREAYADIEDQEGMRKLILDPGPMSASTFPVSLTQLTTIGTVHNHTPIRETLDVKQFGAPADNEIIRVYFDGLIGHIHLDGDGEYARDNPLFLEGSSDTLISGVTYEASKQYENLLVGAWEVHSPLGSFKISQKHRRR